MVMPRVAARRCHDTVWNSIVTSAPGIETGRFPAIGRSVRNRDIDDKGSLFDHLVCMGPRTEQPKPEAGLDVRQSVERQSGY
jgi:hypothetical protein